MNGPLVVQLALIQTVDKKLGSNNFHDLWSWIVHGIDPFHEISKGERPQMINRIFTHVNKKTSGYL